MFSNEANRIGYIILAIILFFGTFCIYDLNRMLNLKSEIIGYFKHTETAIKINDFEYDIQQLLFTNSGSSENEFFAEVLLSDVITGFDKTKNYNLLINNNKTTCVSGVFDYINVDFMNIFISTEDLILLTDTLNIKINFYKDSTKIVFITRGGEQAVKLWTSFIQKNGLSLKIIEDNFNSKLDVDGSTDDAVLLLQTQLNNKIQQYNSLTDISKKIVCIDEINELSALISKINGYSSNVEAYIQSFDGLFYLNTYRSFDSSANETYFSLSYKDIYSYEVVDGASGIIPSPNVDCYCLKANFNYVSLSNIYMETKTLEYDSESFYDFLALNVYDLSNNDGFWDENSICETSCRFLCDNFDYYGMARTDFENKEKFTYYEVKPTAFICLKEANVDFIKSFIDYIYSCLESRYNEIQISSFDLKIDVSEFFNNFVYENNSFIPSTGSIYIDVHMDHWA